jgi:chromosome segregation ATPase
VDSSILLQELEPLKAQIGQVREKVEALEGDLRLVEAELETFSTDQQRFDALSEVCNALDRLNELAAAELFWQGLPGEEDSAGHVERLRGRIVQFEAEIQAIEVKRNSLKKQIDLHLDELDFLHEEVVNAYAREERRKEEFLVEREMSPLPYRTVIMPWTHEDESEKRYRRANPGS